MTRLIGEVMSRVRRICLRVWRIMCKEIVLYNAEVTAGR